MIDNQNNIVGKTFNLGASVLSGEGKYLGYLAQDGSVKNLKGEEIGYLKSNGSFVDKDKKVQGYALQEVAQNRRN